MIKLKPELISNLDTVSGLQEALQTAIELEHSTIPPYLYAFFSLDPNQQPNDPNGKAQENLCNTLFTIVYEEMLHMGLACNLLNAIGGSPQIMTEKFIPKYPTQLPGGVESGLEVPLAPLSLTLVEKVFMEIEEPEHVVPIGTDAKTILAQNPDHITIGQFYTAIRTQFEIFEKLGENIFVSPPRNQVDLTPVFTEEQFVEETGFYENTNHEIPKQVTDTASAVAAIDLIMGQGEGTSTSPLDPEGVMAHYYRFGQIANQKTLIPDPDKPGDWKYAGTGEGGEDILFDPAWIVPLTTNPKEADYPANSSVLADCRRFNEMYTLVLNYLDKAFNGTPGDLGDDPGSGARGMMSKLLDQAYVVTNHPLGNGLYAGPSFEYHPLVK
ncbi:MAG TPA: ferritin-like protein [Chloroflexia bacterium]|nr:ferritin-like protein [Chloroflexia bacterium]